MYQQQYSQRNEKKLQRSKFNQSQATDKACDCAQWPVEAAAKSSGG